MLKKIMATAVLSAALINPAYARFGGTIDYVNFASQSEFNSFAQQMTTAFDYKSLSPAQPLGSTGFDFGIGVSFASLDGADKVVDADTLTTEDLDFSSLPKFIASAASKVIGTFFDISNTLTPMVSLSLTKGLPFGFDVGANIATSAFGNINTIGYELSYAIIEGSATKPALGIKYKSTRMSGVTALAYSSSSIDMTISKGVGTLVPYGGFGVVSSELEALETNRSGVVLEKSKNQLDKFFVGINANFLSYDLFLDWTKIGRESVVSTKLGFRF